MDKYGNNEANESDQRKQLQNIARLVDDHYELEKKYLQVLSELDLLKNSTKNLKHDLRNPLFGITGMLDLVNDEEKDHIEVSSRELKMLRESAQSLLNLVNGTLADEKSEKSPKEKMNIDRLLSSAMMEINRLYLPMAQNKSISLSMSTQINKEIQLLPNFYTNLIQITGNLVANAIKFTPSQGTVEVVFTLDGDGDQSILNMTVSDTGKSMSPDQVSAFNQGKPVARSEGTNGEKSFGIGLQHVQKMVSDDDGHIFVKSEKGKGTLFSLSFPLPDKILPRLSTSHFIVKNGTVSHNGHQA